MTTDKICTFCGQTGHRAHACPLRPEAPKAGPDITDQAIAEYGARCAEEAAQRERTAMLRKFDAYVPADTAAAMRWRIMELEQQLANQKREALLADIGRVRA